MTDLALKYALFYLAQVCDPSLTTQERLVMHQGSFQHKATVAQLQRLHQQQARAANTPGRSPMPRPNIHQPKSK